ncbi:hypothetical protein PTE31013_00326 [Pandoraea terrigena]|uniref:Uncharacterized protein n=1 Tax=Pandoraea terrigena TaxID=2508292 RepID=A0A5E4RSW6_9BURK|nr:hypothetical protein PTE31013_00326 [Pandoraea terrigena]
MTMPLADIGRPIVSHSFGAPRASCKTQWRAQERGPMMCGSGKRRTPLSH